ncbi:MAG TPA: hypothetical protein VLF93_02200 [Candidatus Saccharimonadales bacterium]|nr:hypothetical protein [Candidatus Saccharimonadales bacterium]
MPDGSTTTLERERPVKPDEGVTEAHAHLPRPQEDPHETLTRWQRLTRRFKKQPNALETAAELPPLPPQDPRQKELIKKFNEIHRQMRTARNAKIPYEGEHLGPDDYRFAEEQLMFAKRHPEVFSGLDQSIAIKLCETGDINAVVRGIEQDSFNSLGLDVARELLMNGYAKSVVENHNKFQGLDINDIVEEILDTHQGEAITAHWDAFHDLDPQYICDKLVETDQLNAIAVGLEHFPDVDQEWLVDKLLEKGQAKAITEHLANFTQIDKKELFERVVKGGWSNTLIKQAEFLNDDEKKLLAFTVCDYGDERVINNLSLFKDNFEGLDIEQEVANRFLQRGFLLSLPRDWQDKVTFNGDQLRATESLYMSISSLHFARYLDEVAKLRPADRPRATGEAMKILGDQVTRTTAEIFSKVFDGTLDQDSRDQLGVQRSGEAGLTQLAQSLQTFVTEIRSVDLSDVTLEKIKDSELLLELLKGTTRYETSQWGDHTTAALKGTIRYSMDASTDGRIEPMPSEYNPSEAVTVKKLNVQEEKPQWTEDLLSRYGTLRAELQEANSALDEPQPFSRYLNELRGQIEGIANRMQERLETDGTLNDKGREGIEQRQRELRALITPTDEAKPHSYPLRSLANFEQNFRMLATNDALHPTMRKLVFAWGLRQHPDWRSRVTSLQRNPDIDDVSTTREFIEHIINKETFREYFQDKKSARMFSGMTSTKVLEEALDRTQDVGVSKDTTEIQFVPTRGIMMELSGHIADACWANKYDSIAEAMPNATAVIMKQNPSDPDRMRLTGASMLIETTSKSGEPVLLIRGLNPLENYINHVSVEEFYDQFINYARGIAESRKRKLAIVIDNHCGGSATNRPVLFSFLTDKRRGLQRVRVNEADTTFNGYDVSKDSYYVDSQPKRFLGRIGNLRKRTNLV